MRYYEIIESRRNPEQNPKESTLDALKVYAGRKDVYVSFTSDVGKMSHVSHGGGKNVSGSKLGINPQSKYNTPIGIYTYPIDYVLSKDGNVDFASEQPYLYVMQATKALLDLKKYSKDDFERDSKKLIDMGFSHTREKGIKDAKSKTPAARLWNWTRHSADYFYHGKTSAKWSMILRRLGYSGAVDNGSGLIHPNEPTQAVFFSMDAVKVLEVIPNRFKRKPLNKSIKDINNPNEYVQLAAVQHDGSEIEHINNPSEEVQLAAIKGSPYNIRYIKNPSEAVQLASVKRNGGSIKNIDNPSEDVQLAAVKHSGLAIAAIISKGITPSEDVQLAAVKQSGSSIYYIIKYSNYPSEAVQLAAVSNLKKAIEYIENPSAAVKKAAGL